MPFECHIIRSVFLTLITWNSNSIPGHMLKLSSHVLWVSIRSTKIFGPVVEKLYIRITYTIHSCVAEHFLLIATFFLFWFRIHPSSKFFVFNAQFPKNFNAVQLFHDFLLEISWDHFVYFGYIILFPISQNVK